jgi:archaellum component FlaC
MIKIVIAANDYFPSPLIVLANEEAEVLFLETSDGQAEVVVEYNSIQHEVLRAVVNVDSEVVERIHNDYRKINLEVKLSDQIKDVEKEIKESLEKLKELREKYKTLEENYGTGQAVLPIGTDATPDEDNPS